MLRECLTYDGSDLRALDLCTGSGIQALAVASQVTQVTAVDVNPRAVAMTRHNAALNGITNVEVHLGDLYAPVADQQFDLILANPPFVSSPYDDAPTYHSGGPTGDRVLRRVIAGWSQHLRSGGRAFAVSHVGVRSGESLDQMATQWCEGFPGRVLVVRVEEGSAIDLAAAQALFALEKGLPAYHREVERWVQYLREHRIDTVALILVVAEHNGTHNVEVVDGSPRVLPLPLTPAPPQRIHDWLAA